MASGNSNVDDDGVSKGVLGRTVCVTGAGGFIGTWLVRELLLGGYHVRGTVRNPERWNSAHLKGLEGAAERLTICKANILDKESISDAVRGCDGVFHVASPVTEEQTQVSIAVEGTKNVINAAADMGVRRVVFTSSIGAVHLNPSRSTGAVVDESCWSDLEYCEKTNNSYSMGKMLAEVTATKVAGARGIELAVVIPAVTIGPMLQPRVNASLKHILQYISDERTDYPNAVAGYVDVRDVARAHILVYENPNASGRYLCIESVVHRAELIGMLAELLPAKNIRARCKDNVNPKVKPYKFSNQRLKDLGLEFTPLKKSLYETVKNFEERGYLSLPKNINFQKLFRALL